MTHISLRSILIIPIGVPVNILKALLPCSILATWPAHLKILDLVILTVLSERCKLLSFLLCGLSHSPFASLKGRNFFSQYRVSNYPIYCYITNSMAYGTRKFNAAFTRTLQ